MWRECEEGDYLPAFCGGGSFRPILVPAPSNEFPHRGGGGFWEEVEGGSLALEGDSVDKLAVVKTVERTFSTEHLEEKKRGGKRG